MLDTSRFGGIALPVPRLLSSRFQCTAEGASFALSLMNTRPAGVAAHSVPVFCGARASDEMKQPVVLAGSWQARVPHAGLSSRVDGAPSPILTKSPQLGAALEVMNSGQFASR